MPEIIRPARLTLDAAGIPYAPDYGDVYHSRAGGYAQAREVFMAGNGLPGAWQGRQRFTIVETGFGLGTNFLATWATWRADPARCARLEFVSIERHPFSADDFRAWHGRDAEMAPLAESLAAAWPVLTPGVHRITLEGGAVMLTLVLGEAGAVLAKLRLAADAFYLDGFAPSRNPEMWSAPVFEGLARLAAPGATLATYTVARAVADGLTAAGFDVSKAPGFGGKRDMLVGRIEPGARAAPMMDWTGRRALVIGAGIAGMCAADSLAARGWQVTVVDGADGVARGASSTPAGAMHALLSRDDSRLSRFTRAAYLHMDRRLAALGAGADWAGVSGRVHCTGDGVQAARELVESLALPREYVSAVDADAASALAGTRVANAGWWFPRAAWLHAGSYCAAVLAAHPERIVLRTQRTLATLAEDGAGWTARDANGAVIASAPVAVLASGLDLPQLLPDAALGLQRVRGQLTGVPASAARAPRLIVSGEGYCLPAVRGVMWTGATYGPRDDDFSARDADHAQNLARLAQLLPDNAIPAQAALASHVGMRAVSSDRLPLVGPVPQWNTATRGAVLAGLPRQRGLYITGGMGSRGLTWAALAGEVIAAQIEGEVPPLEGDLLDAIDPGRFPLRQLRRG